MTKKYSKKIFNRNNLANWVIGGIIALFVGKIMEPLFAHIYSFVLNIGGSLIIYIANSTYREISNGYSEQSASLTLYLICILLFTILGYISINTIRKYKTSKSKIDELEKTINSISVSNDDDDNETLPDSCVATSESLEAQIKKYKITNTLMYLFTFFSLISFLILLTFSYGRSSFIRYETIALTNNIEIVSPYISDAEYKQLKSKFHLMETQSDYYILMKELETIADEYSLKLK